MGRCATAIATAALLLLCATPAASAKRASCYRPGWHTVVSNSKVRVFWRAPPDDPDTAIFYGCVRRTGKRTAISESGGNQHVSYGSTVFRLRGFLVASDFHWCADKCSASASTVDLRSRKTIRRYADRSALETRIIDLKLARSGSLGLMEYANPYPGSQSANGPYRVLAVTAAGTTTLDSGEDVDPHSLALGGPWLYWTRAGQARSAALH